MRLIYTRDGIHIMIPPRDATKRVKESTKIVIIIIIIAFTNLVVEQKENVSSLGGLQERRITKIKLRTYNTKAMNKN